jgi:thiol:disulfide interchange protein
MLKKSLVFCVVLLLSLSLSAQILEPIRWNIQLEQVSGNDYRLVLKATIDKGWHLYGMDLPEGGPVPTTIKLETTTGLKLTGKVTPLSSAIVKKDDIFNLVLTWYANEAVFEQKLSVTDASKFKLKGTLRFMGCNDETCLPPTPETFEFDASHLVATSAKSTAADVTPSGTTAQELSTVPDRKDSSIASNKSAQAIVIQDNKHSNNLLWKPVIESLKAFSTDGKTSTPFSGWWMLFFSGFLGGLLALLTPCVWPIIPMTVSFFLKRNKDKKKAIREALLYGLSIILLYLALGIGITLLFGASALNSLSTNAFFNLLFFALLVFFAISFFGAFEIVLPASWSNKIDQKADSTSGVLSIFFMAFTLALVSFSCTGPIIGTLLVEAATTGSIAGPAVGMFGFALALAIPFALFAIFPNMLKRMPKSGSWLQTVKVVLGFLELAFALKFLSVADLAYSWGILPRSIFLVLWILIFAVMGLWLILKVKKFSFVRTVLGLVSLGFAAWMTPGLTGAPLKAISAFAPPATQKDSKLYSQQVHAQFTNYEAGMAYAASVGKPVLLDFSGYGCVNCRKMENSVWQDAEVKRILEEEFVLITLMVDEKTPLDSSYTVVENGRNRNISTVGDSWSYLQRYKFGANAQPFYIMLSPQGLPLGPSYAYNEDVAAYIRFLKSGLDYFKSNS